MNLWMRTLIGLGFLIPAAIIDVKTQKIPNYITFPMIFSGLILAILWGGIEWHQIVIIYLICIACVFFSGIGMGDVKLMMGMVCYFTPINTCLIVGLASFILIGRQWLKAPQATKWLLWKRSVNLFAPVDHVEKTPERAKPLAPYLLTSTILVQGGIFLCCFLSG